MSTKKLWPAPNALFYAASILKELKPYCDRIEIAGSLRREKPEVGDIEMLYVGKLGRRALDLLTEETYDLCGEKIDGLLACGILAKRPNKNGVFAWGDKNKLG